VALYAVIPLWQSLALQELMSI